MKKLKLIVAQGLRYLLAIFMIFGGVQHFLKPDFYAVFVPSFLPMTELFIYLSGVAEVVLGAMLFFKPSLSKWGALGVFALMIIFLPIHVKDVFVDNPAIGSHDAALIRLPVQFVFIAWSYFVYSFLKRR
ncbi:MAG: DoxX family membrane protein [Campylobacteraceae bacterium]|nr:DoxX family membrane protein [Campylobacteraceae bacterium]